MTLARGKVPPSPAQVAAAVSLLGDPSPAVVRRCRAALTASPELAEPLLRERLAQLQGADAPPSEEAERVGRVLADLRAEEAEEELRRHLAEGPTLEEGSRRIGRLVDGGDGPDLAGGMLDELARRVLEALAPERDPAGDLAVLRRVLRAHGLAGVSPARARLADALLAGVTANRRGMPLPLCMAWLLVARRTGVPLIGVNFPGHFLLRLQLGDELFLLDPFRGGVPLDAERCRRVLLEQGHPPVDLRSLDASDLDMLLRTLRNVIHLATARGERQLAGRCARLLAAAVPR